MPLSQDEIEMGSLELPKGHWSCGHVAKGEEKVAECTDCDKDLCEKCIGAHTCLGHDVQEAI